MRNEEFQPGADEKGAAIALCATMFAKALSLHLAYSVGVLFQVFGKVIVVEHSELSSRAWLIGGSQGFEI